DLAVGELPATPIMGWLRERGGPLSRFSQALLIAVPAGLREEDLAGALAALVRHHDALRLRLDEADGGWRFEIPPAGPVAAGGLLRRVDSRGLDAESLRRLIAQEGLAAERRLDPSAGLMLQAVWFDGGAGQQGRLLLTIHHLSVDGVSWRILVPDL